MPIAWAACRAVLVPKKDGHNGLRDLWRSVETGHGEHCFTEHKVDGVLATPVDRFRWRAMFVQLDGCTASEPLKKLVGYCEDVQHQSRACRWT